MSRFTVQILLASANDHKVAEITGLLADCEIVSLRDFPQIEMPEETGTTMRENARIKALHCARESGLVALADDSGIEVDALNGAPGVRSARWVEGSDHERVIALLAKLEGVPEEQRTARYRCAICLADPDGRVLETEATCEGRIGSVLQGENGFGYDPIFVITQQTGAGLEYSGSTMAQVPPNVKARISHRARALDALKKQIFSTP